MKEEAEIIIINLLKKKLQQEIRDTKLLYTLAVNKQVSVDEEILHSADLRLDTNLLKVSFNSHKQDGSQMKLFLVIWTLSIRIVDRENKLYKAMVKQRIRGAIQEVIVEVKYDESSGDPLIELPNIDIMGGYKVEYNN